MYGAGWLEETWKFIQEDKAQLFRMMAQVTPLARSPMEPKGARALQKYSKNLYGQIDAMTPWVDRRPGRALRERLRGKVEPGEIVVLLEEGESADDPLYEGMTIVRG